MKPNVHIGARVRNLISEPISIEEQVLAQGHPLTLDPEQLPGVEAADGTQPTIARSTAIMSVATTLSRMTGFVRTWTMAAALGAGAIASAYNISNNIPNLIFELVVGGVLGSLFIPTFTDVKTEQGNDAAWRFTSHIFNLSVVVLGIVAVLGTLFPEPFIWTQTFKMSAADADVVRVPAQFLFRFFAVQVVIYGAGMVIQAVLNAQRKYIWTALGPVFNNLVVIATFVYVSLQPTLDRSSLIILGLGTTLGVVAMFAFMMPGLLKTGFRYHFELGINDPQVRLVLKLAAPAILFAVTNMVTLSFRNSSVLAVSEQGASVLAYAWMWFTLPYGILAVALATAVFTELSHFSSRKDMNGFKTTMSRGLRSTVLLILPCAALLFALAEPICSLFIAGRFSVEDMLLVSQALRIWSLGLVFYACMMFMLGAFYSLKDTATPAYVNLGWSVFQVIGYIVLTAGIGAWAGFGINGAPLADIIFYLIVFVTLVYLLRKKIGPFDLGSFLSLFIRMLLCSAVAGLVAWEISGFLEGLRPGLIGSLIQVIGAGLAGLFVAFGLASLLRIDEMSFVRKLVKRATGKKTKLYRE